MYVGITRRQGALLSHAGAQLMELPPFQTPQEKSSTGSCTGSEMFSLEVTHGGGVGAGSAILSCVWKVKS